MPLTVRTNGSLSPNIITASWFNDFLNLLTGAMQDQEVTIQNVLILKALGAAPSAAATAALAAGTTLGIGQYVYVYTYANADGESLQSPTVSITTTSGNQKVNLSNVTTGPTGTTKRNIYRTAVGGGTVFKFVAAISDNVTTTFADTVADGSLGALAPTNTTFGGSLILQDSTGAVKGRFTNDGQLQFGLGSIQKISKFSGTATTTATAFNHGLGVVPDMVLLQLTIASSTAHGVYYNPATMTTTQVTIQSDGTNTFVGLAIKF